MDKVGGRVAWSLQGRNMEEDQGVSFGLYQLAGPHGPLTRRSLLVKLPPKAVAVLWALISRAGQIVSKEELFTTVWSETVVGEETLTSFIRLLRRALKDDPRQPRYIATVHRVGYRFIAPLSNTQPVLSNQLSVISQTKDSDTGPQLTTDNRQLTTRLVGREVELTQLHSLFAKALNGERQIVFVTGEAGIGKTTLIDAFQQRLETGDSSPPPKPLASNL
jgi:DNA-binding winged helix-turn-helix (wHTH) protein